MTPSTRLINLRSYEDIPPKVDDFVYIGRAVMRGRGRGMKKSSYHNPFKPDTLADPWMATGRCVLRFTEALLRRIEEMPDYLGKLRKDLAGKTLGCWCTHWTSRSMIMTWCHGIPLCLIADGHEPRAVLELVRARLGSKTVAKSVTSLFE